MRIVKDHEITIPVGAGNGYEIRLGGGMMRHSGALAAKLLGAGKTVVVTDTNVGPLYAPALRRSLEEAGFRVSIFTFPAGETSKNVRTLLRLYAFLAGENITRADSIVALGGGVTGDMAGFAAATWLRGIRWIGIPTTLLAQVDASVGGKTAVDLDEGKNLVGAFWQPSLVICDPDLLKTQDERNFRCGMAEVIKHACIRSAGLFDRLSQGNASSVSAQIIAENLTIKRDIVQRDEREAGERMLLNFGHTIGHAVEKLEHYQGSSHGEAVAVGMVAVTRHSERNGLTEKGTCDRLCALLRRYGLPCESGLPPADLVNAASNDKKRAGDLMNLVLLRRVGEAFVHPLPAASLPAFFGLDPK